MEKFNLSRKLFDMDGFESSDSGDSVIYISSSEDEYTEAWETDCSTDTEQLIARIEREVTTSPMLIGGRIMTTEIPEEDEMVAGPAHLRWQWRWRQSWTINILTKKDAMPHPRRLKRRESNFAVQSYRF